MNGTMNGDAQWQENVADIEYSCARILTELGSDRNGGGEGGSLQQSLGHTAPMAEVLWHWSLLVHRCHGARQNNHKFNMGQELLISSLDFISNQLSKWTLNHNQDEDGPSTAMIMALQKKGQRVSPALLSRLLRKKIRRLLQGHGRKMDSRPGHG